MPTPWLLREAEVYEIHKMASWALVPFLSAVGHRGYTSCRLAAAIVLVVGVVNSILIAQRGWIPVPAALDAFPAWVADAAWPVAYVTAAVVLHLLPFRPFAGRRDTPAREWAHSTGALLPVLLAYYYLDEWPYSLSPLATVALGLAVGVVASA